MSMSNCVPSVSRVPGQEGNDGGVKQPGKTAVNDGGVVPPLARDIHPSLCAAAEEIMLM